MRRGGMDIAFLGLAALKPQRRTPPRWMAIPIGCAMRSALQTSACLPTAEAEACDTLWH